MRSFVAALSLLATFTSAEAFAKPPSRRLVRFLESTHRKHPLADRAGRIPVTVAVPKGVSPKTFGLVDVAPGIGALRLLPSELEAFANKFPDLSLDVAPPRRPLLDESGKWTRAIEYRNNTGYRGTGVVVGIVDTGLDITHPDFRDAEGKTRVAWMLNGGAPGGSHAELEEQFNCSNPSFTSCRIYSADDINALLAENVTIDDALGHGTHVASIAAGNGGPMLSGKQKYVGVAPNATLVIANPSDGSGEFYDPDILNATQFVFNRAEAMGMPAVVNLSVGGDFGSHDGTSPLEQGLAALVGDDKPGRAIVVAAGNSGSLYVLGDLGPLGVHTEVRSSKNADVRVPIYSFGAENGQGYVWVTFRPGDQIDVAFEGPDGETWIDFVEPGHEAGYEGEDGSTAGVINNVAGGSSLLEPSTNGAIVAWQGKWGEGSEFAIHLRGEGHAELWVTGQGDALQGMFFEKALKQGTITVPASHPELLAVGCTVNRLRWKPVEGAIVELSTLGGDTSPEVDSTCYFSSAGPTPLGTPKPEISAPGGFVVAAMSSTADPRENPSSMFNGPGCPEGEFCYVADDRHGVSTGSSMSAPHVTGAVALLLERNPDLTQAKIIDILQAGARYPEGKVYNAVQLGPGELDVTGAVLALEAENPLASEPSLGKSWFVLSSEYARPDESWPVWGTVELRREDGSIASGISASKVQLEVDGGVLLQAPTRIRHGLFRFALAGRKGGGGGVLRVRVLYDGSLLGEQELPIGNDVWLATGGVQGVGGGFSCDLSQHGNRSSGAALGAVALSLFWVRRRRIGG